MLAFRCHMVGGALCETEESRECRYFAPDALPANTLPKHRQRVDDALLNQERAVIRNQLSRSEDDQRLSTS